VYSEVVNFKPAWSKYGVSANSADLLTHLEFGISAVKQRMIMNGYPGTVQACLDGMSVQDDMAVRWILTLLNDLLREDSSAFALFEEALKKKVDVFKPMMKVLETKRADTYSCDKAAWVLSGVMCNCPAFFGESAVTDFMKVASSTCTKQGNLDAVGNLLKAEKYRSLVWNHGDVAETVFNVYASTPSPIMYKSIFCLWLVSYDRSLIGDLKARRIVSHIKDLLTTSRVEKIVRINLTLLRNLLKFKEISEEIVESHVLEVVQSLEYEKWRCTELYDEIREMVTLISHEVLEFSNFDRYEKELSTGQLAWGFIHTSKFWAENVTKFEHNDFGAVKKLAACLHSSNAVTLAVACHDIGEFVGLHPLGKRKITELAIKDRVMELMGSTGDDMREVRREALLCCQKIMLNIGHQKDLAK